MKVQEAIIRSLEDLKELVSSKQVYEHISQNNYYQFKDSSQTPENTVASRLGDFIRKGDTRVRRYKKTGKGYLYYLTKNEQNIGTDVLNGDKESSPIQTKISKKNTYEERALHKLLSSYLKNVNTYSKTIFHEQSNGKDNNQIWTHPDMVGIQFLDLQTKASQNFLKSINRVDTFKMSSYELKREIISDSELKKAFFQAVSNSSWANYGYLVAFEFSDGLYEEIGRLNQSFGIGIIELNSNPYQSKILFPATYRDLDFKTIDKLCKMNDKFSNFIEQTNNLMTAEERYHKATEKEFEEFCDDYFANDTEVERYCNENNISATDEQ